MKRCVCLVAALALSTAGLLSQGKAVMVVQPVTAAPGVEVPYDLSQLQAQLVAELRVMLGKQFEFVAEPPAAPQGTVYTLDVRITGWRPGNAAKRLLIGLGSGREASDIDYRVTDSAGRQVLERHDTVRTNFFSQGAGSTGTLGHPVAQKVADRIKNAKLK